MTRMIALSVLALVAAAWLSVGGGVPLLDSGTAVHAAAFGKRKVAPMTELRTVLATRTSTPSEKLDAVNKVALSDAPTVRGLASVMLEEFAKNGETDVVTRIDARLLTLKDAKVLGELKVDIEDEKDVDDSVRISLFRAICGTSNRDDDEFIRGRLKDTEGTIRKFAVAEMGSRVIEAAFAEICEMLQDKGSWRVQTAAVGALRDYCTRDRGKYKDGATKALMEALIRESGSGRLEEDILIALGEITGEKFGRDTNAWVEWWRKIRAEKEASKDGADGKPGEEKKEGPRKAQSRESYGVNTFSRQILYVIDTSISMQEPIDTEELEDAKKVITGQKKSDRDKQKQEEEDIDWSKVKNKLDLARAEAIRSVRALPPDCWFSLINYSTDVTIWKQELVQADKVNKDAAVEYLKTLKCGKLTNIYGALDKAIGLAEAALKAAKAAAEDKKKKPPEKDDKSGAKSSTRKGEARVPDTIYFLTDGYATAGAFKGPDVQGAATKAQTDEYTKTMEKMLAAVKKRNQLIGIRIHAIAVGKDADRWTLRELAKQNDGTFVAVGGPRPGTSGAKPPGGDKPGEKAPEKPGDKGADKGKAPDKPAGK